MSTSLSFDRYELQPQERRLLADGQPLLIGARAFDVLLTLLQRPGSLVTKHELLERVWAGLVVEEANLTVQVSGLRKLLGSELIATIPGYGYRFTGQVHAGPDQAPPSTTSPATPPSAHSGSLAPAALPAVRMAAPALVGRAADMARLRAALAAPGCVTLVGPAGVGKTALARAVSATWPAGAVWVDLAAVADGAQVPAALALALQEPLSPQEPLAPLLQALGQRLLVLDNAEHLIDAAAQLVHSLLLAQPGLGVLATCQLPLAVPGERVLRVDPLPLGEETPATADLTPETDSAVALFVARARAADHRFDPGAAPRPLLQAICRQLDGLPLALEMAAARAPALGLQGLHEALQQRFAVLTRGARTAPGRHRTLHAALDWSHGLLQPEEQRVFRALGVFAGGFTLDLAVAVAAEAPQDRWAVIDTLATLVDRSLVAVESGQQAAPRYRLLETLRAYALEQLDAAHELRTLRLRHGQALLNLFDAARATAAPAESVRQAVSEPDNGREALSWATTHAPSLAARLAVAVCSVSTFTPWRTESLRWLEASEPALQHSEVTDVERARWAMERARQYVMSDRPEAAVLAQRARDLAQAADDTRTVFLSNVVLVRSQALPAEQRRQAGAQMQALHQAHPQWQPRSSMQMHGSLAMLCSDLGDHEGQLQHRMQEQLAALAGGFQHAADSAETNIVSTLNSLGRHDEALARAQSALARLGDEDSGNLCYLWSELVTAQVSLGQHAQVRAGARRFWTLLQRYQREHLACHLVVMLVNEGQAEPAALAAGYLLQAMQAGGGGVPATSRNTLDKSTQTARQQLGEQRWEQALAQGRSLDEAGLFRCLGVHVG